MHLRRRAQHACTITRGEAKPSQSKSEGGRPEPRPRGSRATIVSCDSPAAGTRQQTDERCPQAGTAYATMATSPLGGCLGCQNAQWPRGLPEQVTNPPPARGLVKGAPHCTRVLIARRPVRPVPRRPPTPQGQRLGRRMPEGRVKCQCKPVPAGRISRQTAPLWGLPRARAPGLSHASEAASSACMHNHPRQGRAKPRRERGR